MTGGIGKIRGLRQDDGGGWVAGDGVSDLAARKSSSERSPPDSVVPLPESAQTVVVTKADLRAMMEQVMVQGAASGMEVRDGVEEASRKTVEETRKAEEELAKLVMMPQLPVRGAPA